MGRMPMVRWVMRVVIAGASGLIGTHLSDVLRHDGHEVVTLVRRAPKSASEVTWDPAARRLDPAALAGCDAVVNLSGAGIGDRPWTRRRIAELFRSRLDATGTLTQAMHRLDTPPHTFISQSASGYYGDAGSSVLREGAKAGTGILSRLCVEWEAAAHSAPPGVRVVTPRTGVVFSRSGGALGRLLPCSAAVSADRWATEGSTGHGLPCPMSRRRFSSCFIHGTRDRSMSAPPKALMLTPSSLRWRLRCTALPSCPCPRRPCAW